jgi:hypothetical protein
MRRTAAGGLFRAVHDTFVDFLRRFERVIHAFFSAACVDDRGGDRDGLYALMVGDYVFVRHIHSVSFGPFTACRDRHPGLRIPPGPRPWNAGA